MDKPGVVVHTFNLSIQDAEFLCDFQDSQSCVERPRLPPLKKNPEKEERNHMDNFIIVLLSK